MKNWVKSGLVAFLLAELLGCALNTRSNPLTLPSQLVGLWRENSDQYSSVVLRKADGTFLGKRMQIFDSSKPADLITEHGKWWVEGKYYIIESVETSTTVNTIDQQKNGEAIKFEVQSISPERFCYLSPDGAFVTERKIGEASESAFKQATVSLFNVTEK